MGYAKEKRPILVEGSAESVETFTSTQSGSTLNTEGISFINSGATADSNVFVLGAPSQAGLFKTIVAEVGTTDAVDVVMSSTASVIFGTTNNVIRFSTADDTMAVTLAARTSTQWGLASRTTGVTLLGSTVTTG